MVSSAAPSHGPAERDVVIEGTRRVLEADPAVRFAYLFGSAARGEVFRDVDVGVVLDPDLGRGAVRFGLIVSALEEALPGMAIDLVDLDAAAPAVRGQAVREGLVLVDRDSDARKEWEIHVTRVWLDLEPWLRRGEQLRREAMRLRED